MTDEKREAIRKKLLAQRAVEDHWLAGGDVEANFHQGPSCWEYIAEPQFLWHLSDYRKKPKPVEGWINEYPYGFGGLFRSEAEAGRNGIGRIRVIKMREVAE